MSSNDRGLAHSGDAAKSPVILDPTLPLVRPEIAKRDQAQSHAFNQRYRRATILASIRQLLAEEGLEGVTVRRIAKRSRLAVQTIYNLVGPRHLAITEAISEYSQYVSLTAAPNASDPGVAAAIVSRELASIRVNPEFCRSVCRIYFSSSRSIFYDFRERQRKAVHGFLLQQQRAGVLRPDVNARALSEQMIVFVGTACVEWADDRISFEDLCDRVFDGYENFMLGALVRADLQLDRRAPFVGGRHWC